VKQRVISSFKRQNECLQEFHEERINRAIALTLVSLSSRSSCRGVSRVCRMSPPAGGNVMAPLLELWENFVGCWYCGWPRNSRADSESRVIRDPTDYYCRIETTRYRRAPAVKTNTVPVPVPYWCDRPRGSFALTSHLLLLLVDADPIAFTRLQHLDS